MDQAKEQLTRTPHKLQTIEIDNWKSISDWQYRDVKLINYISEGRLTAAVAV